MSQDEKCTRTIRCFGRQRVTRTHCTRMNSTNKVKLCTVFSGCDCVCVSELVQWSACASTNRFRTHSSQLTDQYKLDRRHRHHHHPTFLLSSSHRNPSSVPFLHSIRVPYRFLVCFFLFDCSFGCRRPETGVVPALCDQMRIVTFSISIEIQNQEAKYIFGRIDNDKNLY